MRSTVRKFALTVHITVAVGWIGAVIAYLALVVGAWTASDAQTVGAAWIGMELLGWYVLLPLAVAALGTGIVMDVGTRWGYFDTTGFCFRSYSRFLPQQYWSGICLRSGRLSA